MQWFSKKKRRRGGENSAVKKFARAVSQGERAKGEETARGWALLKPRPMQFFSHFVEGPRDELPFSE